MSQYGVTAEGFRRPTFEEILNEYQSLAREILGPVNFGPESAIGQQLSIQAEREDRAWAAMEATYLSQYPNTASRRSLDNAVQLTGIVRLPATRTIGQVVLIGVPGTSIPQGNQFSVAQTNATFETVTTVTIDPAIALEAFLTFPTVLPTTAYTVTINGTPYTYTSDSSPTADEIIDGLIAQLPPLVDGEKQGTTLRIISGDFVSSFVLSVSANITVSLIGTPAQMRAINTGPTLALAGTLINIVNPVVGLERIFNYTDLPTGRNEETDSELRARRQESLQVVGSATVEAIRSRLIQNVADVLAVSIVENRSDTADMDGRPPHSYEVVVSGGVNEEVAQEIWNTKPAGIETTGDIEIIVTDSQGGLQPIRFTRPTDKYIWVNVELTLNGNGSFPDGGEVAIKQNIVAYGQTLGVGGKVLFQALFGPVYAVPGIVNAEIEIASTPSPTDDPTGLFNAANIVVGPTEISVWSIDRIEVTYV
jgi:uncharacterized phage protein gp47/JayE